MSSVKEYVYDPYKYADPVVVDMYEDTMMDFEFDILVMSEAVGFAETESFLKKCIQEAPLLISPYEKLCWLYKEAGMNKKMREADKKGFEATVKVIRDKKGALPEIMEWGWVENRPLIGFISRRAIHYWREGKEEDAKMWFEYLLNSNVGDNVGIRYYWLCMQEGISHDEFIERFVEEDVYKQEVFTWFDTTYPQYPFLVEWFRKVRERYE